MLGCVVCWAVSLCVWGCILQEFVIVRKYTTSAKLSPSVVSLVLRSEIENC